MAGKRPIGGTWTTYDTGVTATINDSHFVTCLGIDSDGYIHITYNMHGDPLNYIRSDNPEDPSAFTSSSMTGNDETEVTYPRFFMANNILFFSYRDGGSSVSSQMLNKYTSATQTWSDLQHPFVAGGDYASYVDNFAVGDDGKIHVSFMWRTNNSPVTLTNYGYAYSDDGGTTWKKADGSTISIPITQANPDIFEAGDIPGLCNQNMIDVDSAGHPHIAYFKNSAVEGKMNYFHAWHNGTSWVKTQITTFTDTPDTVVTFFTNDFARPGIVIDRRTDTMYIFGRKGQDGYIRVYKSVSPYTSFEEFSLGSDNWGVMEFGGIDFGYWHSNHVLNMMATRAIWSNSPIYSLESNMTP